MVKENKEVKVDKIIKDELKGYKVNPDKKVKFKNFVLKKFELFVSLRGYNKGAIISLKCHRNSGIPKDSYWRKRLAESAIDGCMAEYKIPKVIKIKETRENISEGVS